MDEVALWSTLRRASTTASALTCLFVATLPASAQTVQGRLVDASSGKPVAAAEMALLTGGADSAVVKRGLTTDSGTFKFTAAAGRYRLKAERIGYRSVTSPPFDLVASEPLNVELKISVQAVPLSPLTVISSRPPLLGSIRLVGSGYVDREQKWGAKGLGLGTFIDKEAIERRQPRRLSDLLRTVPGITVEHSGVDKQWVRMKMITKVLGGPCKPTLYIDGVPLRTTGDTLVDNSINIDDLVSPSSVAGIEVYSSLSKPGRFMDMGVEPCGAIVIWTGFAGMAGGGEGLSSETMQMLGEHPHENENTRTAQHLLTQADSMGDKSAAKSLYRQALHAAQAAIADDSTNPLPRLQAGEAAIGIGQYKEADQQLDTAVELRPLYQLKARSIRENAWFALQQQASSLVHAGQYDQAIPIFEEANVIYRERPEVMLTLGQLYGQEGKDDRALANLDSAALIIQDSSKLASVDSATAADWKGRLEALEVTRAQVLAHAGRYEESISEYRKLVQKHPDAIGYKRSLAQLFVRTKQNDEAKQIYTEMLQDTLLTAADLYQIGVGFYRMADYKDAAKGFSGASNKRLKDRDALEMWTRSLMSDSAYAQVSPVAERWSALDPNSQAAYMLEAKAVNQQGNGQKADELVNKIQALTVTVDNLNIRRGQKGGAIITGIVTNKKLASGAQVTIAFTFYDDQGNSVGTQSQTVAMGAQGQSQDFTVRFDSDAEVGGYGYTLTGS